MMSHVSSTPVLRRVVGGVQVLLYPNGPYLEVAERVRAVHRAGKALSVERGEVLPVRSGWIYRAHLQVNGQRAIGDAEIHLGAAPETPDGTNPLSCAQTSAVGQALEFAGFGDLKAVLARLGRSAELVAWGKDDLPEDGARREIAGVQVVMPDQTPYVTVAERLFHLHLNGTPLQMEQCEILELAGVWVYRATVLVGEQRYVGDAEIFFEAAPGTPDHTHPISCGQISAVGNALALAGFGDVRSILERTGKETQGVEGPALLASADAMIRAQARARARGLATPLPGVSPGAGRPIPTDERATAGQRQHIATLCQRLGTPEPTAGSLNTVAADRLIADLQAEEADLLRAVDEVRTAASTETPRQPDPPQMPGSVVEQALVRQLKQRWRATFQPAGDPPALLAQWDAFKTHICGEAVKDVGMRPGQYEQLVRAFPPTPSTRASAAPVRQAPRLAADQSAPLPKRS